MTSAKPLTKLYDRLTPHERFLLTISAKARGDKTEAERLIRECPKHCYEERDADYDQRIEASQWLTLAVMTDTLKMLGWLDLLAVLVPLLDAEDPSADPATLICETAKRAAASRIKAVWEAFKDTCTEVLGVDAELMVRANGVPLPERLAAYADILAAAERDGELYAEYRETAAAVWQKALAPGV
jgi:hypothetical protein